MILILGASGYIGGNLYKKFLKKGFDVEGTYSNKKIEGLIHFGQGHPYNNEMDQQVGQLVYLDLDMNRSQ